jgi:hypothetical protein
MSLSIIESRAISKRIKTNSAQINGGSLSIIQSRAISKAIKEDLALLNGGSTVASESGERFGLEPDGKENEVKTAKGTKIVTGFMVVEASKLIVSHDEQGNVNPEYPQEMQPRDRARDTSQAQIVRIAKNLDPDMLGRTRVAYQGAPIVGKDGVVESGNGRAMAITLAYKLGKSDDYRAWLMDIADMYGLNPDKIEHMKRPVLVRVRKTDVERAQFAIEANQSDMLAMTATEKAKSDAARLTDAIVSKLSADGDLTAAGNRDFIMGFLTALGDDETAGLLTTGGQPTKQLYDRAQAAVFAKAYNDDRLLELMADAEKPEIANIIKSLNQAAQPFITARNISENITHETTQKIGDAVELSLDQQAIDAIVKATEMLKKAKDSGMPIEELIKQNDLFGDVDPVVAQMALFIKDNNRSSARMGAAFTAMAEFVVKELKNSMNESMFEDEAAIDMIDVLKAANAQLQKQYGDEVKAIGVDGGFIDLFTETRGQKKDREAFLASQPEPATLSQAQAALKYLKGFIGMRQLNAIATAMRGEERQFFFDKVVALEKHIKAMPKTYDQDGMGDKAIAYLHYFKGGMDWHITERDMDDEQLQAFGLANLGYGGEMGYISIVELIKNNVELDLYWTPKTIGAIRGNDESETENEPVPVPGDSDETITPSVEESDKMDNPDEEQINEIKAVEDLAPAVTGNTELDKQRAKLRSLADLQERMKAANKIIKSKTLTDEQKKDKLAATGEDYYRLMKPDFAGRIGYADYLLTNNNAVIKNTQKRIEQLEAKELAESLAASGERETSYDFDGGTIDLDYGDDRLRVNFDSKPDADMISKMKQNGFKWSPTNTAWQRQLTDNAISTANYLFGTQIKTAASAMKEEVNKHRGDVIVPAPETQPQGNPMKTAFIAELDALKAETDIEVFDRRLDEIAGRIEGAGLMEELDAELNAAADVLTALLAEAEKAA